MSQRACQADCYVLYNVQSNLRKPLQLFLQAVPGTVDIPEIEKKLMAIDKVKSVHHIHVWSLDGEHNKGELMSSREIKQKTPGRPKSVSAFGRRRPFPWPI